MMNVRWCATQFASLCLVTDDVDLPCRNEMKFNQARHNNYSSPCVPFLMVIFDDLNRNQSSAFVSGVFIISLMGSEDRTGSCRVW